MEIDIEKAKAWLSKDRKMGWLSSYIEQHEATHFDVFKGDQRLERFYCFDLSDTPEELAAICEQVPQEELDAAWAESAEATER